MIEALMLLVGIACGCASALVPGLHGGLVLALLVAMGLGGAHGALFVAGFAGANVYARRLGAVYHPSAGSDHQASAEVAVRMTANGRGRDALALMVQGTDFACAAIGCVVVVVAIGLVTHVDVAKAVVDVIGHQLPAVIVACWAVHVVVTSKNPGLTALGLALTATTGYVVMHHPVLAGNPHQLAPLMVGTFGVPIMLGVIIDRVAAHQKAVREGRDPHASWLKPQGPRRPLEVDARFAVAGTALGALTGFLAGLGAGSLVAFLGGLTDSDEDYLLASASGEAANDVLALVLIVLAGMGRSGEAVALGKVVGHHPSAAGAFVVLGAVVLGALGGRWFVLRYEDAYMAWVAKTPVVIVASLVIGLGLLQVVATGHAVLALALTAACVGVSWWCRENKLPLQVGFGGLAVPVVASAWGLVPPMNSVFFGL